MQLLSDKPETDDPVENEYYDLQHETFWDMFVLGRLMDGEDDPEIEVKLDRLVELREIIEKRKETHNDRCGKG